VKNKFYKFQKIHFKKIQNIQLVQQNLNMHFNKMDIIKAFRLALLRIKPQADEEEAPNTRL